MGSDTIKLGLLISATGGKQTVAELLSIRAAAKAIADEAPSIARLSSALGITGEAAKKLATAIGKTPEQVIEMAESLKAMKTAGASSEQQLLGLISKFNLTADAAAKLQQALKTSMDGQAPKVSALGGGVGELAFKFNNVVSAIQSLAAAAKPAYDFLIGSNEKLNAQLLSSQTNLASATRIFQGGQEITDPTVKINATRPALQAALQQIEKDTKSLVGVTSQSVNELFQITLTNAADLNNQSKQFPDPIAAATSLTKGWAASLKVVGIPLDQARQEINSIVKGQVDQNSILAKNLNITNDQVNKWKGQGVLVDELNKRLEVFVAGNAIAARSIEGIFSNIQEFFETLGRQVGAPFLEPTIAALGAIEIYLYANQAAITSFMQQVGQILLSTGAQAGEALKPFGESVLRIAEQSGPILLNVLQGLTQVFSGLVTALGPIATILARVVETIATLANTDIGGIAVQAGVATIALGNLSSILLGFAATAVPAVVAAVGTFTTAMGGAVAVVTTAATGGIPALVASFPALIAGLTAVGAAAAPLALALAPLAGAIALTFIVKGTQDMKVAQEAIDALAPGTARLSDESLKYAQKLKALNEEQKKNGSLTDEQQRKLKVYRQLAGETTTAIDEQIRSLKETVPANEAQTNAIKVQIAELEKRKKLLADNSGGIQIQGKELEKLGTTYEQLEKKATNAERALKSAQSTDDAGKAAKTLTETIALRSELGQITAEQAEEQLRAIASNSTLEVEVQQKAQAEITKLKKEQLDLQKSDLDAQISAAEIAALKGSQTPAQVAETVTKLKKEQLDLQLADLRSAIAAEQAAIESGSGSKSKLKGLQNQEKKLTADSEKEQIEGVKRIQDEKLKELEAGAKKEIDTASLLESKKNSEIAKLQASGAISAKEAESQKLASSNDRISAELQAEQKKFAQLQKITGASPEQQKKLDSDRIASQKKIADLQTSLSKNEIDAKKAAFEKLISESQKATQALMLNEKEKHANIAELEANGVISKEEAESRKIQLTEERIRRELELERALLSKLKAQPAGEERDKAILESQQRIAEKRIQLAESTARREAQIRQEAIAKMEAETQRATALQKAAETERLNAIQQSVNAGNITTEQAVNQRLETQKSGYNEELRIAQDAYNAISQLSAKTPKEREDVEKRRLEAAQKIAEIKGRLLQNEADQQGAFRQAEITAIEKEQVAASRAADVKIENLKKVGQQRDLATTKAELASGREIAAIDRASKAIDRQNQLLNAKANLQKATSDAALADTEIQLQRITNQKNNETNPEKKVFLLRQEQVVTAQLEAQKRAALVVDQSIAKQKLEADLRSQQFAANRAVIEARLNELKAKSALLSAQQAQQEVNITNQKLQQEASAKLAAAELLAPGAERDKAIAAAQAQQQSAQAQATQSRLSAQQQVDIAQQQKALASEGVQDAIAQKTQQQETAKLQQETLELEQKTALKRLDATEQIRQQNAQLEIQKQIQEAIAAAAERSKSGNASGGTAALPGRKDGGSVDRGTAYLVGEREPEIFVPGVNGTILNQDQIARNLSSFQAAQALGRRGSMPSMSVAVAGDDGALLAEVKSLRSELANRVPHQPTNHYTIVGESDPYDKVMELQSKLHRQQSLWRG